MIEQGNQNELQGYVDQYAAAYEAHRVTYALRVPPPEKAEFHEVQPESPKWQLDNAGSLVMLGLLVTASVIVSGSRTIAEFGDVGIPAFVMLELGLITYAFIRTSRNYNQERHESLSHWVSAGMGMAFIVLLVANIDAVLTRRGVKLPEQVALVIDLLVAVSAPVLAFISGDVMGMYSVIQRQSRKKAMETYEEQKARWVERRDAFEAAYIAGLQLWRDGLNASWNTAKRQLGVQLPVSKADRRTPALSVPSGVSVRPDADSLQIRQASYGYNTSADGQQTVIKWLTEHPNDASLGSRPLGKLIGVSHDTANKGRQEWQRQQALVLSANSNGNGHSEEGQS